MPSTAKRAKPAAPHGRAGAATRERILVAALRVFAMRGFDGARTREIAESAGANLGLIKYYFDGKENLWKAAVERAFAELQAELGDALADRGRGDERQQLEQVVRRFVRFLARNPAFMQLMNDEGKRRDARMRWLADRFVRPFFELVRSRVEAAQARGLLPDVSPVSLHYIVLGAAGLVFSGAAECEYVTGTDPTTESFADAHADTVVRLLLGAPPAPREKRPARRAAARAGRRGGAAR